MHAPLERDLQWRVVVVVTDLTTGHLDPPRSLVLCAAYFNRARLYQVALEPVDRQATDLLKRTGLLEEVCRAGDDGEFSGTAQLGLRVPVELEHLVVGAPDDQECRRAHRTKVPSEVWAP